MRADLGIDNGFEPFISDADVSLDGRKGHVPIKDLRDMGAKQLFAVESVSLFSPNTEMEDFFLMQGLTPIPRHGVTPVEGVVLIASHADQGLLVTPGPSAQQVIKTRLVIVLSLSSLLFGTTVRLPPSSWLKQPGRDTTPRPFRFMVIVFGILC